MSFKVVKGELEGRVLRVLARDMKHAPRYLW